MNNKMERVLRLLLEYTNYLDLKYEYLIDLKYQIKKEIFVIYSEFFNFNNLKNECEIFTETIKNKLTMLDLKEEELEYLNQIISLLDQIHDENFENIYLKVKETCDKYFKRKNHKKNLTRRELAYLLLRDEDRLEEEVYLFDMEDSEYLHLDEISSEYVDVVKEGTKEEKLRSFTEEGMRYYNKNKIGQKRITILS